MALSLLQFRLLRSLFGDSSPDTSLSPAPGLFNPNFGPVTDGGIIGDAWAFRAQQIIVSRMQDHIVETDDGHLHMLINTADDNSLLMLTSTDGGESWEEAGAFFGNVNRNSSSDFRLSESEDGVARVSYANLRSGISYGELSYDETTGTWTEEFKSVVKLGDINPLGTNSTIAEGASGNLFIAYSVETDEGLDGRLSVSLNDGETWTEFSGFEDDVGAGSMRVVPTAGSFGVLYVSALEVQWVTYDTDASDWTSEVIAEVGALGRYSSHFSTTTFDDDIYFATVSHDFEISFLHYDAQTDTWSEATTPDITPSGDVSSVQMSADTNGNLYMSYDNDAEGTLEVIKSTDEGQTWEEFAILEVPGWLSSTPTRFEAPENFDDELPIVVQTSAPFFDRVTGLYAFSLDTDNGAAPSAESDLAII